MGRNHKQDLQYTADGRRDTASNLGKPPDEQKIQATMQEETAAAIHRLAEAVEELNATIQRQD